MLCQKCKTNNTQDAVFCINCGQKLKVICPKCKTPNNTDSPNCTNCGLRLIRFCPACSTPNNPLAQKCQSCGCELLKKCPQCGRLNLPTSSECKKCQAPLTEQKEDYTPHPVIRVELFNSDSFEKISKKDIAQKLINKFFQCTLTAAKKQGLKTLKLSTYCAGIELKNLSYQDSAKLAFEILNNLNIANQTLKKINLEYKTKILITEATTSKHGFGSEDIKKSTTNKITTDKKIASELKKDYKVQRNTEGMYIVSELQPQQEVPQAPPKPEPAPAQTQEVPQAPPKPEPTPAPTPEVPQAPPQPKPAPAPTPEVPQAPPQPEPTTAPTPEVPQAPPKPEPAKEPAKVEPPSDAQKTNSPRILIAETLKKTITKHKGGFILVSSEPGDGKTTLIGSLMGELQDQNLCMLQADCHNTLHTTSFATIQTLIRSMFNLPIINIEADKIKMTMENALRNNLSILDDEAINTLINIVIPTINPDADIKISKEKAIHAIKVLFRAIESLQKIFLVIEEIEHIDIASAEIIDELINEKFLDNAYILATSSNNAHPSMYFQSEELPKKTIISVKLQPLTEQELDESLSFYIQNSDEMPDEMRKQIHQKTKGSALFLEETIMLLNQMGIIYPDQTGAVHIKPDIEQIVLPDNLEELITVKLDNLFKLSEQTHQVLAHAICLGHIFYPPIIQKALEIEDSQFHNLMQALLLNGICMSTDNINFKFKNKHIYEIVKNIVLTNDEEEKQVYSNLLNAFIEHTQSPSAQIAFIAQRAQNYQKAFVLWATGAKECLSIGDNYLYLHCQKGALENIDYSDYSDKEDRKLAIYEQLGITNYETSPEDSIDFLSKAIKAYEEKNDKEKIIYLAGYLVKSLILTGNIQEAMGYIDLSIDHLNPQDNTIEIALLKFLKLKSLIEIGNLGEVITLIQAEILPALNEGIQKHHNFDKKQFENIKETITQSQIILIKALAMQGNKNYHAAVEAFATNNEITPKEAELFAIDALHKTFNGMPETSNTSIQKTRNILKPAKTENKEKILLELEFTSLLNKFIYSDASISQDVAPIAQKAKKLNHSFIYNFLQVVFAKQLLKARDLTTAANLINDCLSYFAEQKIALFAIPSWIILSQIQATFEDYDQAISIAQQALEVSSKPQIQNNYAIIQIKKLLANYFCAKEDFEMAKMHLEEGINFAKENELIFWEGKLYIELAQLHKTLAQKGEDPQENEKTAEDLIKVAKEIAKSISCKHLEKLIVLSSRQIA